MARYFHGTGRRGPYFEGWYLKCQTRQGRALALIPAFHIDREGRRSASLQVIAENGTWWLAYPDAAFHACEGRFAVQMDQSVWDDTGLCLKVERDDLCLQGRLRGGPFVPLASDIMGPFRFLPGMECSHGVLSMGHPLSGSLTLNGEVLDFTDGTGYIETDRGRSFPSAYLWTQCAWRRPERCSLMLSVATIPLAVGSFTGCICAVMDRGQEYRLATYRGARVEKWSSSGAVIRQGPYRLEAEVIAERGHPLQAPVDGDMRRTIHESLCAAMRYRFWRGEELLLSHTDEYASFEYADAARPPAG